MPLIVKVFVVVIFRCNVTVVPALIVTFSNVNEAALPPIVCDVPEKTTVPLFPALNDPLAVKFPPIVNVFREVEIVPFEFEIETFPLTEIAALLDVAVRVDANVPPTVRFWEMVKTELSVSVAAFADPLMVNDCIVIDEVREG